MGIRVSEESLKEQLKKAHTEERSELPFHKMLLEGKLPYTIGGGIGQSRLCMLLLGKAHIGEVQASIWPPEMIESCEAADIKILYQKKDIPINSSYLSLCIDHPKLSLPIIFY